MIALICEHLTAEAAGFSKGDYGDPASIHDGQMPGLRALEQGHDRIDIGYTELPAGARITHTTTESPLITALHAWLDAQVTDHGQHAAHGRPHHPDASSAGSVYLIYTGQGYCQRRYASSTI